MPSALVLSECLIYQHNDSAKVIICYCLFYVASWYRDKDYPTLPIDVFNIKYETMYNVDMIEKIK